MHSHLSNSITPKGDLSPETLSCSWTGTNTGKLTAPDGSKIPPTGKTVNINNCFIYEFENGKIKSMKNYLDMMGMMGQLGLAG